MVGSLPITPGKDRNRNPLLPKHRVNISGPDRGPDPLPACLRQPVLHGLLTIPLARLLLGHLLKPQIIDCFDQFNVLRVQTQACSPNEGVDCLYGNGTRPIEAGCSPAP